MAFDNGVPKSTVHRIAKKYKIKFYNSLVGYRLLEDDWTVD